MSGCSDPPHDEPKELDARFTFANERTLLAWHRTALGLIAAGVAVTQVLPPFEMPGARLAIGLPLMVFGGVIALISFGRWKANEKALRLGQPLPDHWLPRLLTAVIAFVALAAAVATIAG